MFKKLVKGNKNFIHLYISMSGIAGIVGAIDDLEYHLATMIRSQEHRGGEYKGFWVSPIAECSLGIAHCGKVVSEVEEYVHQPFIDEDTQLAVVVEGDIYNYKSLRRELDPIFAFATDSSVEVVSKAYRHWGADFLSRLQGTFAIVIHDRKNEEVFLARDRFGVKPLYYTMYQGVLYFASEIRALFSAGVRRALSADNWAGYMIYSSYGSRQSTFWDNIYQLPAGSSLRGNGYSINEYQWYNIADEVLSLVFDYEPSELVEMLREELLYNTMQSMTDVSRCAFRIARRIESQLLHTIAAQYAPSWKICTFAGDFDDKLCRLAAMPVWITGDQVVDELQRMSYWIEEPFDGSESLIRTLLFRNVNHNGIRVLCSGVGLDALWQNFWDVRELNSNYRCCHTIFEPAFARLALPPTYDCCFGTEYDVSRYIELNYERVPHILRFFDRSAAEAGISIRFPFLDGRLVPLSFALPLAAIVGRETIFRESVIGHYPYDESMCQTLQPIHLCDNVPVREWLLDALYDLRRSEVAAWLDARQLLNLREDVAEGSCKDYALIWKIVSLHRHIGMC